ncbi:MAG: ABC transporter ATP-binding protein [Candidatus Hydrogenedentota bacterium]
MNTPLLEVTALESHFKLRGGTVRAVDGVSLAVNEGEVVGLVGESGCGKTTLARAIVGLAPATSGRIAFEGTDLTNLPAAARHRLRPGMQLIFQDPYASLNPRMTVFDAIAEPLLTHRLATRADAPRTVALLMDKVGLARRYVRKYPHEFSGGQRQRIAFARALALKPRLILADEPVSALDVSVQAQILNLLRNLCADERLAMLFISHDLAVVRHMAQRIAVMYLGHIVETAPRPALFAQPAHPYTRALLSAIPVPDPDHAHKHRYATPKGDPPSPMHPPAGCPFHTRCPYAQPACSAQPPPLACVGKEHFAACICHDQLPPFKQHTG